jgi:hypothetical protein
VAGILDPTGKKHRTADPIADEEQEGVIERER